MMHWKQRATRCAVVGCERQRRKGWSTCDTHAHLGRPLAGAGRIDPIHVETRDGKQVALPQEPLSAFVGDDRCDEYGSLS